MNRRPENTPPQSTSFSGAPEQRVAELLHAVDTPAPEHLHRSVREMVDARGHSGGSAPTKRTPRELIRARLTPTLAAMALAALAGIAVAVLSGSPSHRPGTTALPGTALTTRPPGVGEAAALTLSAATASAPQESHAHGSTLDVAVDGVAFPYWAERYGWQATGERTDTLGGRRVTTVFYTDPHDSRIGYAIVGGVPAPAVAGGTLVWHAGVPYRILREHGEPVVAWQRGGRLCVLSGRHVSTRTLLALAAWERPAPV